MDRRLQCVPRPIKRPVSMRDNYPNFPLADDIVALGDQIRGAPELQIRERFAEVG